MASFGIKHTFVSGVCVEVSNDGELVVTGGHFADLGVYDQSPEWRTGTERARSTRSRRRLLAETIERGRSQQPV